MEGRCRVDRCALFVDAGYVLSDGAMAVHGTRHRESVSWDYSGLLQFLSSIARDRTGLPLLRCYWYEATVEGRRTAEHDALADLPGLKLRLVRMRPGRREGVESEIHRDLATLARNGAVSDALVISAEEDLAQVVADVQDLGVRVTIVHITVDGNWTISRSLRQECDDIIEVGDAHLRPYVELISGAEPAQEEPQPVGAYAGRPLTNGHGTVSILHQQALPVGSTPAPPAIYTAPVVAEYQRAAQPIMNGQSAVLAPAPPGGLIGAGQQQAAGPGQQGQPPQQGQQPQHGPQSSQQALAGAGQQPQQSPAGPGQQPQGQGTVTALHQQPGGSSGVPGLPGIPGATVPGQAMPGQQGPGQGGAGQHSLPGQGMPGQGMPGQGQPGGQGAPGHGQQGGRAQTQAAMPGQDQPGQGMPGQGQGHPGQGMPGQGQGHPGQGMPGQGQGHPGQGHPGQGMAGQGMPAPGTAGQGQQGMPGQGHPGQQGPGPQGQEQRAGQQGMPGQGGLTLPGLPPPGPYPGMPGTGMPQGPGLQQGGPGQPGGQGDPGRGQSRPDEQGGHQSQPMYAAPPAGFGGPGQLGQGQPGPGGPQPGPRDMMTALGQQPGPALTSLPGQGQPGPGHPGDRGGQQRPYPAPPGRFGGQPEQPPGQQYPGGQPGRQEGAAGGPPPFVPAQGMPQGPYSGPHPAPHHPPVPQAMAMSLADAVQAAHAEGFEFGQSVAREAPALWLEAVLARKPRMPSDLEARLLQDSALPIDSLLHDEVRHALRRGFWDALERARR
jgi:hypothetical protein